MWIYFKYNFAKLYKSKIQRRLVERPLYKESKLFVTFQSINERTMSKQ